MGGAAMKKILVRYRTAGKRSYSTILAVDEGKDESAAAEEFCALNKYKLWGWGPYPPPPAAPQEKEPAQAVLKLVCPHCGEESAIGATLLPGKKRAKTKTRRAPTKRRRSYPDVRMRKCRHCNKTQLRSGRSWRAHQTACGDPNTHERLRKARDAKRQKAPLTTPAPTGV